MLTDKIFELSALNVRSRLHCELLRLAAAVGVVDDQALIRPSPTHVELANRIGTHREAVTRELRDLTNQGILTQTRKQLHIKDITALTQMASRASHGAAGIFPASKMATDGSLSSKSRR